jgi:Ras-related protein Rab-8A
VRGVILMYDMTSDKSFQELQYWHNEVLRCCPAAAVLLVGSKSDLTDQIKITSEDGAKQAKEWGSTHLTVSAATGQNVEGMFTLLLAIMKKTQS